jgi:hypothetical protein
MTTAKRTLTSGGQEKLRLGGLREWKTRAESIHGDRFDYSKVDSLFKTQKSSDVEIFCNQHKRWFFIKPFNHLRFSSGGCEACDQEQVVTYFRKRERKKFSEWFSANCADRLEMRSEFKGTTENMEFFCKVHQRSSLRKPTHLMNNGGYGCDLCSSEATAKAARLTNAKVLGAFNDTLPDHVSLDTPHTD